jgi:hypothetical protein
MSIVKNKKMKRLGIKTKAEMRKARKYIRQFVKCNRGYAYNNAAANLGYNNEFWKYGERVAL